MCHYAYASTKNAPKASDGRALPGPDRGTYSSLADRPIAILRDSGSDKKRGRERQEREQIESTRGQQRGRGQKGGRGERGGRRGREGREKQE